MMQKKQHIHTPQMYIQGKINTNDPQLAELKGISVALQLAEHTKNTNPKNNKFTILCDCKGAVKYINHQCLVPYRFSAICQGIQEQRSKLTLKQLQHNIRWMPGHTPTTNGMTKQMHWLKTPQTVGTPTTNHRAICHHIVLPLGIFTNVGIRTNLSYLFIYLFNNKFLFIKSKNL